MTSESPNPFPVVHHFPPIVSTAEERVVELVLVVVALELFLGAFGGDFLIDFDGALAEGPASVVILPPDAWPP